MINQNRICSVTTIKEPLGQTLDFVHYHLNIGVDHLFLFFDNPNDKAIKILESYKNVTCFRCDDNYWRSKGKIKEKLSVEDRQRFNANLIYRRIKDKYEWFIHLDGDELIFSRKSLKKILKVQNNNIDFFRIPTLEAVSEKEYYGNMFKEVNLFKNNFGRVSKKFFKGHICGKSIIRTSAKVDCVGIHRPEPYDGLKSKIFLFNVRLLHFDCCGFVNWKTKWKRRMRKDGIAKELGITQKKIFEQFKKIYSKGNEKELHNLYPTQFFISPIKKRFFKFFGLLREINLDKTLFDLHYENKLKEAIIQK